MAVPASDAVIPGKYADPMSCSEAGSSFKTKGGRGLMFASVGSPATTFSVSIRSENKSGEPGVLTRTRKRPGAVILSEVESAVGMPVRVVVTSAPLIWRTEVAVKFVPLAVRVVVNAVPYQSARLGVRLVRTGLTGAGGVDVIGATVLPVSKLFEI